MLVRTEHFIRLSFAEMQDLQVWICLSVWWICDSIYSLGEFCHVLLTNQVSALPDINQSKEMNMDGPPIYWFFVGCSHQDT